MLFIAASKLLYFRTVEFTFILARAALLVSQTPTNPKFGSELIFQVAPILPHPTTRTRSFGDIPLWNKIFTYYTTIEGAKPPLEHGFFRYLFQQQS